MSALGERLAGVDGFTLTQLAVELARPALAVRELSPVSGLGMEAVCARIVHDARKAQELAYFGPVSGFPGFARALSRTLRELRLAGVSPAQVSKTGAPGADLAKLLERFEAELEKRKLADLALVMELAEEGLEGHRLSGLPVLFLDAPLDSRAHHKLFEAISKQSPHVLVVLTSSFYGFRQGIEILDPVMPLTSLDRLRRNLFVGTVAESDAQEKFEVFSAPGEGLEAVEIARRILRLVRTGVPFDQIAILLRESRSAADLD